ncbi:MAG: hypothetical protein IPO92_20450 [Saprospiraceae bacterium]|nr:hypothetical protein [Saprospiraceae bacterium]
MPYLLGDITITNKLSLIPDFIASLKSREIIYRMHVECRQDDNCTDSPISNRFTLWHTICQGCAEYRLSASRNDPEISNCPGKFPPIPHYERQ